MRRSQAQPNKNQNGLFLRWVETRLLMYNCPFFRLNRETASPAFRHSPRGGTFRHLRTVLDTSTTQVRSRGPRSWSSLVRLLPLPRPPRPGGTHQAHPRYTLGRERASRYSASTVTLFILRPLPQVSQNAIQVRDSPNVSPTVVQWDQCQPDNIPWQEQELGLRLGIVWSEDRGSSLTPVREA